MLHSIVLILTLFLSKAKEREIPFVNVEEIYADSLWAGKYEVTNDEYLQFTEACKDKNLLPQDSLWLTIPNKPKAYEEYYSKHPAYANYPVVNITFRQAREFCEWKTRQINTYLKKTEQNYKVRVRLPSEQEWEYIARGGLPEYSTYSWEGLNMRIKEGKNKGMMRCNFKAKANNSYFIKNKKYKKEEFTVPVNSYRSNGFGLYNVCGNVAELTLEKTVKGGSWNSLSEELKIKKTLSYTGASPYVGFRYVVELNNRD